MFPPPFNCLLHVEGREKIPKQIPLIGLKLEMVSSHRSHFQTGLLPVLALSCFE